MLEFKPDPLSDKARKRRSSRTSGLTSKDPWANILLFRTVPDERHNIYDWQAMIKPQLTSESVNDSPITPSVQFSNFSNPFASRETRRPDLQSRTPDRNVSSYPHAPRERPSAIISPSPSLRSRRSDLSSQASSQHPPMGFTNHSQAYPSSIPTDLPSPASTSYEPQFAESWSTAQGRSSALSSHTRGSNSIASAVAPPALIASTPPGPRETILDRAFQMRCIPGSERITENDEDDQMSSLARFEALMREVDEKKLQRAGAEPESRKKSLTEWNIDEDTEEESDSGEPTIGNDEDSDEVEGLELSDDDDAGIPTKAQVTIPGRRTPIPGRRPLSPAPSTPVPVLNAQAMSAFHGLGSQSPSGLRPRTGTKNSPYNQEDRFSRYIPQRSVSSATVPISRDLSVSTSSSSNLKVTDGKEKRLSSTSTKRLSFTEFARRLSSTSSLLLVQTNVSSNSGRGSGRASMDLSDAKPASKNRDDNCAWRNSNGVFGNEGGFL